MPWLIQHKCNISDPEPSNYAAVRMDRGNVKITRVQCPNTNCGEYFDIIGHDLFADAVGRPAQLPPGFLLPSSYKRT